MKQNPLNIEEPALTLTTCDSATTLNGWRLYVITSTEVLSESCVDPWPWNEKHLEINNSSDVCKEALAATGLRCDSGFLAIPFYRIETLFFKFNLASECKHISSQCVFKARVTFQQHKGINHVHPDLGSKGNGFHTVLCVELDLTDDTGLFVFLKTVRWKTFALFWHYPDCCWLAHVISSKVVWDKYWGIYCVSHSVYLDSTASSLHLTLYTVPGLWLHAPMGARGSK